MTQLMTKTLGTWALVITHQDGAQTVSESATTVYSSAQVADSLIGQLFDASGDEHYASWGWQSVDELLAHLEQTYRLLTGSLEYAHD